MDLLWSPGLQLVLWCYFNLFRVDPECAVPVARGTLDLGKERLASKLWQDNTSTGHPPARKEAGLLLARA